MTRWVIVCEQAMAPALSGGAWDCPTGSQQIVNIDAAQSSSGSAMPPVEDVAKVWSVGFSLVMVCFVVGRVVGTVLEMIRKG